MRRISRACRQDLARRREIARRLISLEVVRLSRLSPQGVTADYMSSLSGTLPAVHRASMVVSGAWIVVAAFAPPPPIAVQARPTVRIRHVP